MQPSDAHNGPEPPVKHWDMQELAERLGIDRGEIIANATTGNAVAYVVDPDPDEDGDITVERLDNGERVKWTPTGRCSACGVLLDGMYRGAKACKTCKARGDDLNVDPATGPFRPADAVVRRNGGGA